MVATEPTPEQCTAREELRRAIRAGCDSREELNRLAVATGMNGAELIELATDLKREACLRILAR